MSIASASLAVALSALCAWAGPEAPANLSVAPTFQRALAALSSSETKIAQSRSEFARLPADPHDKNWVKAKLAHMYQLDVLLRSQFDAPFSGKYSDAEKRYYLKLFDLQLQSLDKANAADLKPLLKIYGWFKISDWGKDSDLAAWLIVQHADTDVPFQREVLVKLKALYPTRETDPANFALLSDRVAIHENRLQRFGTQGGCVSPGHWEPDPIEDPAQVDGRRRSVGLESEEDYMSTSANGCH